MTHIVVDFSKIICYRCLYFKHEEASVKMFNHMIEKNKLERDFQEYGIQHLDLQFIEEQISGKVSA